MDVFGEEPKLCQFRWLLYLHCSGIKFVCQYLDLGSPEIGNMLAGCTEWKPQLHWIASPSMKYPCICLSRTIMFMVGFRQRSVSSLVLRLIKRHFAPSLPKLTILPFDETSFCSRNYSKEKPHSHKLRIKMLCKVFLKRQYCNPKQHFQNNKIFAQKNVMPKNKTPRRFYTNIYIIYFLLVAGSGFTNLHPNNIELLHTFLVFFLSLHFPSNIFSWKICL